MADGFGLRAGKSLAERDAFLNPVTHDEPLGDDWLPCRLDDDRFPSVGHRDVALEGSEALDPRHPARACFLDKRCKNCHALGCSRGVKHPAIIVALEAVDQRGMVHLPSKVWMILVEVRAAYVRRVGVSDLHSPFSSEAKRGTTSK